jgi:kynureninase
MITRDDCRARDAADSLAPLRRELDLPPDLIYLDGNSLGPLPRRVGEHLETVVRDQWGRDLIRSWNVHGWMDLPLRLGRRIAPLIGAAPDEVAVTDSTSVDLFKLLAAALELRPERRVVLSEADNFPTDLYMVQGLSRLLDRSAGRCALRTVERREDLGAALDPAAARDVAIVMLTQVDYRTGALHDLAEVTRRAHDAGALMLWDLSHSTGALEVDLDGAGADLAVGCTYKYLNGGPGAPAFLYVARRHHEALRSPLQGWLGHAAPFDFDPEYRPAEGIARFLCGTPPILSLAALDAALELFDGVDLAAVRAKSVALGDLFLELVDQKCGHLEGLEVASPRDGALRGSQVSLRHPEGYAIVQALIARNVIGDFRAPDVLRFGLPPLYLRFVDVWDAVRHLREVLETGEWDREDFRRRAAVT